MRLDHDVVCFGKVPTYGDFVRFNADGAAARALDTWFREGLYNARSRLRRRLKSAAAEAGPHRFVFSPTTAETLLIGVLQLSRDETGRTYPFVVATERTRHHLTTADVPHVPAGARDFFDDAGSLVRAAVDGDVEHGALPDRLKRLNPGAANRPEGMTAALHFLQTTTLKHFAETVWDSFEDSRKYLVFKNLIDALAPLRGSLPARLSLGLRFPLGPTPRPPSTEAVVGMWLGVALRVLDASGVTPTVFWTDPGPSRRRPDLPGEPPSGDGAPGDAASDADASGSATRDAPRASMLLFFRPPPPSAFAQLLPIDVDDESICPLEHVGREKAARAALSLPRHVGELLESETSSLHTLLDGL